MFVVRGFYYAVSQKWRLQISVVDHIHLSSDQRKKERSTQNKNQLFFL